MPSPKAYRATDGSMTYRVRLRVNGAQTSETFTSHVAAVAFCSDVDAMGAAAAVEQRNLVDQNSTSYIPTVAHLLEKHVADLTGVDQRTRDDYLSVARRT